MIESWELKGRDSSRYSKGADSSMHVMLDIRLDIGSCSFWIPSSPGMAGAGSVRARAMLQLLAPRSRTFGKCLLISYAIVSTANF